jgi:hypothetical protein
MASQCESARECRSARAGHTRQEQRREPIAQRAAQYRWRNLVERLFNKLKNWRA